MKNNKFLSLCTAVFIFASGSAQVSFSNQKGSLNPLNNIDVGERAAPSFVDIDSDGDQDCFIGNEVGVVSYYKNMGTAAAPIFTLQSGASNPLNMVSRQKATLFFVDIDGNGTKDCFIGGFTNAVQYFVNTGSVSNASFVEIPVSSTNHPFYDVNFEQVSIPSFVDIDGDGDQDCFVGEAIGIIRFYKNFGTATAPELVQQSGGSSPNPLDQVDVGDWSSPAFLDIDGDGDQDCLVGSLGGTISYFRNIGTAFEPNFIAQTGLNNPFDNIIEGTILVIGVVDIDNDGRHDCFVGNQEGVLSYFRNTTGVIPVELIQFGAKSSKQEVILTWTTATERNTHDFSIERSTDGKTFIPLSITMAKGSNSRYNVLDKQPIEGMNYYRLSINDLDGSTVHSKIESILFGGQSNTKIKIFPTVVEDVLNFQTAETTIESIQITNSAGQIVLTAKSQPTLFTLSVSSLPSGIYVVRATDTEGGVLVEKVVKQ